MLLATNVRIQIIFAGFRRGVRRFTDYWLRGALLLSLSCGLEMSERAAMICTMLSSILLSNSSSFLSTAGSGFGSRCS